MNLLLFRPEEVAEGRVRLAAGRRAEHLSKVLKVEPGQELRAGILGGALGRARVEAVSGGAVELTWHPREPAPASSGIDLVLALPRPPVFRRVLQLAASARVEHLDLVRAWRVEKSFFASPALEPPAVRRQLILGAEQGITTHLPEVAFHHRLLPFVEGLAARRQGALRLLAHPEAPTAIEDAFEDRPAERLRLAIGPEGGWIDREVETFAEAGFLPVRLVPWILRVESAVAAFLAQAELLRRLRGASDHGRMVS